MNKYAYPIPLIELLHRQKNIRYRCTRTVNWQLIASYRNGQEDLDRENEHFVRRSIAEEAARKVDVFQDQNEPEGRKYYGDLYALSQNEMYDLLYHAYSIGLSAGKLLSEKININIGDFIK
jgi:hypothetical protein